MIELSISCTRIAFWKYNVIVLMFAEYCTFLRSQNLRHVEIPLGEDGSIRVKCTGNNRFPKLDVREYYTDRTGKKKPTKMGINFQLKDSAHVVSVLTAVKQALNAEIVSQTEIKEKVIGALRKIKDEKVKASCYGCMFDRPSQDEHIGGCISLDETVPPNDVTPNEILLSVDAGELADQLELSVDQVEQCLVDIWADPKLIY